MSDRPLDRYKEKRDFDLTREPDGRESPGWLLLKKKDELSGIPADPVGSFETSVESGRTMEEIAKGD